MKTWEDEGFFRPQLVWALIENELPRSGRERSELQPSVLTRKEGVVLMELNWALIGERGGLGRHCLNAVRAGFDFDVARHVL